MMKTFERLLFVITIIFLTSCNKFLDTKPLDFYTPEQFYTSEEQLNSALATVYSQLGDLDLYGQYYLINGFDADDGYHEDRTFNDYGPDVYNVSATDSHVAAFWRECYVGINRANLLLENLNKPKMDENKRNKIKGEALFLRAYFYFLLVQNFGSVPLKLKATVSGNDSTRLRRTPPAQVYAQIIKDMEEAEPLVSSIAEIGHGGRVNKSAVRAILARVNLFMAGYPVNDVSRYKEAKKWCEKIIDEGYHELNPNYAQIFINYSADKYDPKESIWEIEFFGNTQSMWREAGRVGTYGGIEYSGDDPDYGFSYGALLNTGILWLRYPNEDQVYSYDLRRDVAIAPYTLKGTPAKKTFLTINSYNIIGRDCGKYRREYEVVKPKEKNYSPINYPVVRYSDVLLMYAEAENAINGPTSEAIESVNKVRRRAYGKYLNGAGGISEGIDSINISEQGAGYKSAPVVSITGGGGDGTATAQAVLKSGKVTTITITNPGIKFSSEPLIALLDTNKVKATSAATAYAVLTKTNSADLLPSDYADKDVFLRAIQDERSRELCFEGLRKGDLIRWGIFLENMKAVLINHEELWPGSTGPKVPYANVSSRDVLWPIPTYEMGLNPDLTQNPGW